MTMIRTGIRFEEVLARLYTDEAYRRRFLAEDPLALAREAGLDEAEAAALAAIDRDGLALAADRFAFKRDAKV